MTNIKSSKPAGVDKLSGRFFKNGTNILVKPISAVTNYRPISLLPSILKIIERVILTKQMRYYQMKIYNYQSGFQGDHSKNLCLSFLTNKVLKGFDEGLFTRMILVDLHRRHLTL